MRKLTCSLLVFVFTFFACSVTKISAKTLTSENGTVSVAKGEIINDDLFVYSLNTVIDGIVSGDVFIGSQNVIINGRIDGNLHVIGNSVTISGNIKGNTYIGAGDINVNSAVIGGSLLVGGQNVSIDKNSVVGGSVMTGADNATIDSQIKRNVYIGAASANFGPNTIVERDLYYEVGKLGDRASNININENAKIKGETHRHTTDLGGPYTIKIQADKSFKDFVSFTKILSALSALIVGFLYLKFFSGHFFGSAKLVSGSFLKSLGTGFLITIIALPLFIILLFSIIGIQVAWVSSLFLALGLYLSQIVVGYALGNWIFLKLKLKKASAFLAMAMGLLTIFILKLIPPVGFFTSFIVTWTGLGALATHTFSKTK